MTSSHLVTASALHDAMRADRAIAVLDVRDPGETERGHIFGTTPLPRRRIESRIAELVVDCATPIVVVDGGEGRAAFAASTLRSFDYRDVSVLDGGIDAWRREGFPLATGTNVPSKRFGETVHHDDHVPSIDPETLTRWRDEGRDVLLCDVRTPGEYGAATIPGSVSAPSFDLLLGAATLHAHETVVVHCAGRTRSIIGTQTLRALGLTNVVALENGTMGWILAERSLERRADRRLASDVEVDESLKAMARARAEAIGVRRVDDASLAARLVGAANRYVFDVRSVAEHERGHVPGARNVPGGQLVQRTDDFIAVRRAPIVVVDDGDVRADVTAMWLKRMALPDVSVLDGGLGTWRAAGRPIEAGRATGRRLGWDRAHATTRAVPSSVFATMLDRGMSTIDVDDSVRFSAAHVPGARWLPRGWLELRVDDVVATRDASIGVTCNDGIQSTYAAATLAALGYRDVVVLGGGTRAWIADGRPIETAAMPPQDDVSRPPYERGRQAMRDYLAWETALVPGNAESARAAR